MLVKKVTLGEFSNEMHKEHGNAYTYQAIKALYSHLMETGSMEIMECSNIAEDWCVYNGYDEVSLALGHHNAESIRELSMLTQVINVGENHILVEDL